MTKKLILFPTSVLLLCLILYGIGLIAFSLNTLYPEKPTEQKADAIVILTGGENRITRGIELFNKNLGSHILITGVGKDITLPDILPNSYPAYQCCLTLGYNAQDTIGNVTESYAWLDKNNLSSFYLVTSSYHMPRAKKLFKQHDKSDNYVMYTYPVKNDPQTLETTNFWRVLFTEYNKFLYTWITIKSENGR